MTQLGIDMNTDEDWYNLMRHPEHYRMNDTGRIVFVIKDAAEAPEVSE